MKRLDILRRDLTKDMLGLEVAPWFNPVVAKRDGYNVKTLDVFDNEELMSRAHADPKITVGSYDKIEPVDYVGSAVELADLVPARDHGTFDYIVSSHNFEHLPDPIRFLQGCQTLLKPDGRLIMAIPDGRACFDYFRAHTSISEWLEAYVEKRVKPNPRQVFAMLTDFASPTRGAPAETGDVNWKTPNSVIENKRELAGAWQDWSGGAYDDEYLDSHCSVFTPASFQLLIHDCAELGLTRFYVTEVTKTTGVEFIAKCRLSADTEGGVPPETRRQRRTELLHQVWAEHAMRVSRDRHRTLKDNQSLWSAGGGPLRSAYYTVKARMRSAVRSAKAKRKAN